MKSSQIDLHCHSSCSDGTLMPRAVVQRAFANGVKVLALTDHDAIDGLPEAQSEATDLGLILINGCEFSCQWEGIGLHVLGLNLRLDNQLLHDFLAIQLQRRWQRAEMIDDKLKQKKMSGLLEGLLSQNSKSPPSRPDFAAAMVQLGYVKDSAEAFRKYLGTGKAADIPQVWPQMEEVLGVINHSAGNAVIAHPCRYGMNGARLRKLLVCFRSQGGTAVEVVYSGQKQGEIGSLTDYSRRFDLKASLGSDFHTPKYPWADLGRIPPLPGRCVPVWDSWGLDI